jgi:hypothetical protein
MYLVGFLSPQWVIQRENLGLQEVVVVREAQRPLRIPMARQAEQWGYVERHGAGHLATLEKGSLVRDVWPKRCDSVLCSTDPSSPKLWWTWFWSR